MARRPAFWIAFIALGLGGAVTAVRLFSVALPNISIDITMDRGEALERATDLAAEYAWGVSHDRSAASFGPVAPEVQMYVELEGGGPEAFASLSGQGVYEPYQWRVRRFTEHRIEESTVDFTPAGRPYGFRLRLSETDSGSGNLDGAAARALAEATATEWGVDMAAYRLLESSQEALPGGRVDHELVFERTDRSLGEARFRLRIGVAGSRASELTHFVFVPEAFSRRYAEMRSTNDAIALVSQALFMVLFVLLGAGVGSALLLRRGWLEWRAPLAWGAVIAFFFGLNTVNQLPLSWMSYDTALSSTSFVLQQLGASVAIGLLGAPLIGFFLLAGESLGRRAFAGHVQQWRFWSPEVASSSTAAGMTVAAYLLVGIQLGYVVLFYLGTQRLEGWWSPADALIQPDLLATYLPWLQAVSGALFAAFWEESVFRAVPIACAALLGARYGRPGLWIWSAVVFQAVVFAAAHANYPQQPSYARVVELTGPALLWGIVYVRYGLVPTILAHFLYDLSLFSLVLFESRAFVDQLVIVAVALAPLGVVVAARARAGARSRPPEWAFNGAWSPRAAATEVAVDERGEAVGLDDASPARRPADEPVPKTPAPPAWRLPPWSVPVAGAVGALLWLGTQLSAPPPPRLWGDVDAARESALAELRASGAAVDAWSTHATASAGATEGRDYVYEEAGPEAFAELRGTYFDAPRWVVRFVDWDADPEARVEEYRVWVGDEGRVGRVWHALPEARPGPSLAVDDARAIAVTAVAERLGLATSGLREVEAEETSLPSRTDWTFTFTEIGLLGDVEGEARIQVRLAGDEVVDVARSVRVPEAWARERREVESRRTIMRGGFALLLAVCFGGAAIAAVVAWSRGRLAAGVATRVGLIALAAFTFSEANSWPATVAAFTTNQPWGFQVGSLAIALLITALVAAPAVGLVGALAVTWLRGLAASPAPRGAAVALGLLYGGVVAAGQAALGGAPLLRSYAGAAARIPLLNEPLRVVLPYLLLTFAVLMFVAARTRFSGRPLVQSGIMTLLAVGSVVMVPAALHASIALWGLGALAASAVLLGGLRIASAHPSLVPGIVGTVVALQSLRFAWEAPHAGARPGGVLAALVVCGLAWTATRLLTSAAPPAWKAGQSVEGTRASVGSL
jgi:hypothetical protein